MKPVKMKYTAGIYLLLVIIIITSACRADHYKIRNKLAEPDIEIMRLEKDLFSTDPADLREQADSLRLRYGSFLQLFAWVINAGSLDDSSSFEKLVDFTTDRFNYELYETVIDSFPNMSAYEKEFEKAWARYNYYFPDSLIPGIYTFISGFNNSIIVGDSVLATGLDRYLGSGHAYYKQLGLYNYVTLKMIPERIVPDALYAWAKASYPQSSETQGADLLSNIIHEGKLYYFTKCMLYDYPDSLLFGFTAGQMKFCRDNEYAMWEYLIEHDMLYSSDLMLIRKLTGEAPFTSYFSSESPGRASVWIGFRIVESYMKNNGGTGLGELMLNNNYREILEGARYNPGK